MSLLVILALSVIIISFICSFCEGVFLSITPTYVSVAVREQKGYGLLLEHLKEHVDRPISAILTINTVANSVGSALIGAIAYDTYGSVFVSIFSTIFGLSVLIFAEFLPKILGTVYWKQAAPLASYSIQTMIFMVFPIVWLAERLGSLVKRPDTASVTREEMIATAELGVEEGSIHRKESMIIRNLLGMNSLFVSDIMTPRSVLFALESDTTVSEVFQKFKPIRFSRIPVFHDNLDHIHGMTMRFRIHEAVSNDLHDTKISAITTPISTVSERMTVAGLLEFFIRKKEHIALAVDEYGVTTGLVSLEDAVETLLGVEIVDELDHATDMRQYALEQWQIRKNQMRRN